MADQTKIAQPTDLSQVGLVLKYDIFKHLRSRRLTSVLLIEALVITLILVIPPALGQAYPKDAAGFVSQFTGFAYLLAIIGTTMFAGDAIVSEFQNRTGYLIFPNPVKRWVLFLGKYLSSLLIIWGVLLIYYMVAILTGAAITGGVSDLAFASMGLAMLFAGACTGIGYLLSSVMKTATSALVFTFFLLFLILPIVDGVGQVAGARTDFSLTFQEGVMNDIMQTPYPADSVITIPTGTGQNFTLYTYVPHVDTAIIVMSAYMLVTSALALVAFRRKEMVG